LAAEPIAITTEQADTATAKECRGPLARASSGGLQAIRIFRRTGVAVEHRMRSTAPIIRRTKRSARGGVIGQAGKLPMRGIGLFARGGKH
jgi:hypothetical protein